MDLTIIKFKFCNLLHQYLYFVFFSQILFFAEIVSASPDYLTLQSRIIQPNGQNLEAASVNYRFSITDPVGTCVVYQEDFSNVSMVDSKGLVAIKIGSGTRGYPVAATTMKDIFTNFNSPVFNCQAGGTYTAASSDQRKIVMQFNDGSGWQTVPSLEINSTPFSLESLSAQKLGLFPAGDYVRSAQFATCVGGEAVHFNGTNFTCVSLGGAASSVAAAAGLAGTPSISFSGDTNTGLYSGAADTISISNNGSNTFNITSTALSSTTTGGATITQINGTAAAPTFSFAGDADTGWYRAAADTLAASTAGAERIRIDSSGNIGVGTANPGYLLDVNGSFKGGGAARFTNGNSGGVAINSGSAGYNALVLQSNNYGSGGGSISFAGGGAASAYDTRLGWYSANTLILDNSTNGGSANFIVNGNVGIGTTSPTARLHIEAASGATVFGQTTTGEALYGNATGSGTGVRGVSVNATGVVGESTAGKGVTGHSFGDNAGHFSNTTIGALPTVLVADIPNAAATGNILEARSHGTTKFSVNSSGNVGIGTTAPTSVLHTVASGVKTADYQGNLITNTATSGTAGARKTGLAIESTGTWNGASGKNVGMSVTVSGGTYNYPATFVGGNVGIDETTPPEMLTIGANTVSNTARRAISFQLGGWSNPSTPGALANGDKIILMQNGAADKAALGVDANASIWFQTHGGPSSGYRFFTGASGSGSAPNEILTIINNGSVGIGTTSPQTKLQVEGIISPATNNTYTLGNASYRFTEVYATNGVINTSDRREKKDIFNTDLGLDFINKLRPVSYRWNTGVDNDVHYGLIAQEAERAVAESGRTEKTSIVTHDEVTDRYGVRYSELIAPLIKAVQELFGKFVSVESRQSHQDREIASLKTENAAMKAENDLMKKENAAIKIYLCSKDKRAPICK